VEPIIIEYKLEFKEYFWLYIPLIFKNWGILIFIYGVAIAVGVLLLLNYPDIAISLLIAYIFCFAYTIQYNYTRAKKQFYSSSINQGTIKYTFTDAQISIETIKSNSTLSWKALIQVEETKNIILLYRNKRSIFLIPKKGISQEKLLQFRNVLRSIPGLKIKLRKTNN
jgi:hypothetical protein